MSEITDAEAETMLLKVQASITDRKKGMREAAQWLLARHPEWQAPRPMHEPVTDAETKKMADLVHYGDRGSWFENVRMAGSALLAGRAAPKRERVEVTPEMIAQCQIETGYDAVRGPLDWLAARLNGEDAAPADPRVAVLIEFMDEIGVSLRSDMPSDHRAAQLLAKLDEVKP